MVSKLVKVRFYFPPASRNLKIKRAFARAVMASMRRDGSVKYAGYRNRRLLRDDLLRAIGNGNVERYQPLSATQEKRIVKVIQETIRKCRRYLPVPTIFFVFVFPYFPTKADEQFGGVMGVTPYHCVLHLFVSPFGFTKRSLEETVAHELNHAVFYYHHHRRFGKYTLLDHLVMEGLAEHFREEVIGGTPAPWSRAFPKEEAFRMINVLRPLLSSRNDRVRRAVLFGGRKYKRWAGYSVGYWLVKKFIAKRPKLSWGKIMSIKSEDILEAIKKA